MVKSGVVGRQLFNQKYQGVEYFQPVPRYGRQAIRVCEIVLVNKPQSTEGIREFQR